MSRGFRCALIGIGVTIFAWFSPWLWPAWPAFGVLEVVFSHERPFSALAPGVRTAVVAILIAVNVTAWSAVSFLGSHLIAVIRTQQRKPLAG